MRSLFVLLTSLTLTTAHGAEFAANFSGFATYTAFSNQNWFDNTGVIAQNAALHYGQAALKVQVANDDNRPIRRAAVEWVQPVGEEGNVLVQVGRVPRLNTFFSDVSGNPDEWGMAVLPLSTYNRRKVHSLAFNALDGIKLQGFHSGRLGATTATFNWGTLIQEYTCEYQMEAMRRKCNPGWALLPIHNDSGDFAIEHNYGNFTALVSYNKVSTKTVLLNPLDRVSVLTTSRIKGVDYRFTRLGLKYSGENWYVQSEHGESRVYFDVPAGTTTQSTAWDDYYLAGYYFTDALSGFAGYAVGHERGSPYTSRDRFIGASYRTGRWAYTAELHDGNGTWQKPGSTFFNWDKQFVGSVTVSW